MYSSSSEWPLSGVSPSYDFLDSLAPHGVDTALSNPSVRLQSDSTHGISKHTVGNTLEAAPKYDTLWTDERRDCRSPQPAPNFEFMRSATDISQYESLHYPLLLAEKTQIYQIGIRQPASTHINAFCGNAEGTGSYASEINSSFRSTSSSSLWPFEFLASLQSTSSAVVVANRQRRDSISSRGSSSGLSPLNPEKRAISPLRRPKKGRKYCNDVFRCDMCEHGFGFRHRKDLERHKLSVHSERPRWFCPCQPCKFATQGFTRKDKALQHVRTHRDEPYMSFKPIWGGEDIEDNPKV